eukprot:scaffold29847_cov74-Cyclotella_meneghiniana.AAC.9
MQNFGATGVKWSRRMCQHMVQHYSSVQAFVFVPEPPRVILDIRAKHEQPILETSRLEYSIPTLDTRTKAWSGIVDKIPVYQYSYPSTRHPNKVARVLEYYPSTHLSTIVSSGNTCTHPPELNFAWRGTSALFDIFGQTPNIIRATFPNYGDDNQTRRRGEDDVQALERATM